MKGKIEVLEVQEGWIRTEWGRPDLNRWPPGYQPGAQTMLSYGPFPTALLKAQFFLSYGYCLLIFEKIMFL